MKKRDVSVLFIIKDGKILLQRRGPHLKRFPNSYGLFGGGVEKNENSQQALRREIKEEAGIARINKLKLILTKEYSLPEYNESGNVYVYSGEIESLRKDVPHLWCPIEDVCKLNVHRIYLEILEGIDLF